MALTPEQQSLLQQLKKRSQEIDSELSSIDSPEGVSKPTQGGYTADTGPFEATARGFAQGLLGEHADELTAMAEAAITSKPYEQAVAESRQEYKLAEQKHPWLSTLGGIAGGVGQTLGITALTGGAAAPAAAAKTVGAAQKLKNILRAGTIPTMAETALGRIGQAATVGATQGAITAVGRSEEQMPGALLEAVPGAVIGGAVGGVLGGAVEGVKKGAGVAGKYIGEKIEKGELDPAFRYMKEAFDFGKKGFGFTSEASQKKIQDQVVNTAKEIQPVITNTVNELTEVRNHILRGSGKTLNITEIVRDLFKSLKKGTEESRNIRKALKNKFKTLVEDNNSENLPLESIHRFGQELKDLLKADTQKDIQKEVFLFSEKLSNMVNNSIPEKDAASILMQDPRMLAIYTKYAKDGDSILNIIKNAVTDPNEAAKMAEDIQFHLRNIANIPEFGDLASEEVAATFKKLNEPVAKKLLGSKGLTEEQAYKKVEEIRSLPFFDEEGSQILLEAIKDPKTQEAIAASSPLKLLNNKISNVLTASSALGDVMVSGTPIKRHAQTRELIANILRLPKEGMEGQLTGYDYDFALKNLREGAGEEVYQQVKDSVDRTVKLLEVANFIKGPSLEGTQQSVLTKTALGPFGRYGAQVGGTLGQIVKASKEGKPGPVPLLPTTFMISPNRTTLEAFKSIVDNRMEKEPSASLQIFSEVLNRALESKDEVGRAAAINTLMQYDSFRNLVKRKIEGIFED